MNCGQLCYHTRLGLQDLKVSKVLESQILRAVNDGTQELAKIIRQARSDFFITSTTGTIAAAVAPNYSSITLPSDFAELKTLMLTDSGYEGTEFKHLDRSDPRFTDALIGGGAASGYYFDLMGISTMILAPGFDAARSYLMTYVKTIPEMTKRSDTPDLPTEDHPWIVTYAITDILGSLGDPRLAAYESKLEFQRQNLINSVNETSLKEPQFVRGFMEEEGW